MWTITMRELLAELGSYDEWSHSKKNAEGRTAGEPAERVEDGETPRLTWTETIERSNTATELILHS